jgi:type IV pilus assembly protein PilX
MTKASMLAAMTIGRLREREHGAVLVVALLFLVVITILGITAMTSTTFEEKMAGNARDHAIAFQAAEAALSDAWLDISPPAGSSETPRVYGSVNFGNSTQDAGSCSSTGLCLPPAPAQAGGEPPFPSASLAAAPSIAYGAYTGASAIQGVAQQPRYLIEFLGGPCPGEEAGPGTPPCARYRVTARGYGANPNTEVTLQAVYQYPWSPN